jgi:hypothetical protein
MYTGYKTGFCRRAQSPDSLAVGIRFPDTLPSSAEKKESGVSVNLPLITNMYVHS